DVVDDRPLNRGESAKMAQGIAPNRQELAIGGDEAGLRFRLDPAQRQPGQIGQKKQGNDRALPESFGHLTGHSGDEVDLLETPDQAKQSVRLEVHVSVQEYENISGSLFPEDLTSVGLPDPSGGERPPRNEANA